MQPSYHQLTDTIAAIATPPGQGAVAIIRLSGENAFPIAQKTFSKSIQNCPSHTVQFGTIHNSTGEIIDEVLLILMRTPRSYTGEDTIEIQCHGGNLITRRVLETALSAGARLALPGEFTFRAFINGKIDLTQAEAVQELISAKNDLALNAAEKHLQGALFTRISFFQKQLTDIAAILEAWIDFPEEGLEFATQEELLKELQTLVDQMALLESTFEEGKIISSGISLCLIGTPNAGKSSLMNALLGKQRAIVTDIPGTTRDTLQEDLRLGGLHFQLIDTAGIRETEEMIEREGILRSHQAMKEADLNLLVIDASKPLSDEEDRLLKQIDPLKTILVWNKIDLPHEIISLPSFHHVVKISAKTEAGLQELKNTIEMMVWKERPIAKEEVILTNLRHKEALSLAISHCISLIAGLKKATSPEFLTSDIRASLKELATIIGTDITEDILSAIFSKFCVGK